MTIYRPVVRHLFSYILKAPGCQEAKRQGSDYSLCIPDKKSFRSEKFGGMESGMVAIVARAPI